MGAIATVGGRTKAWRRRSFRLTCQGRASTNEELFESVDLQEAYNKLCKVAAKYAMSVDLGLKKIATLELEMKNLLLNFLDGNELVNKVRLKILCCLIKLRI